MSPDSATTSSGAWRRGTRCTVRSMSATLICRPSREVSLGRLSAYWTFSRCVFSSCLQQRAHEIAHPDIGVGVILDVDPAIDRPYGAGPG